MHPFWRFVAACITAFLALYGYISCILFIFHFLAYLSCGPVYCGLLSPADAPFNPGISCNNFLDASAGCSNYNLLNQYQNSNITVYETCLYPPVNNLNIPTINVTSGTCSSMMDCGQICNYGNFINSSNPPFNFTLSFLNSNNSKSTVTLSYACCDCSLSTKIAKDGCPLYFGKYMLIVSILSFIAFGFATFFNIIPVFTICFARARSTTWFKILVRRSAITGWLVLLIYPKSVINWKSDLENAYKIDIFYTIFDHCFRTVAVIYFNQAIGDWTTITIINLSSAVLSIAWTLFRYLHRVYKLLDEETKKINSTNSTLEFNILQP